MCVQLRPVIKDDSMFTSSVQGMSEVYKYTTNSENLVTVTHRNVIANSGSHVVPL